MNPKVKYLNIIPFVILSLFAIGSIADFDMFTWAILIFFWIFMPCIIWSGFALLGALSKKTPERKTYRKVILWAAEAVVILFAAGIANVSIFHLGGVDDMRKNYDKHQSAIDQLGSSVQKMLDPGVQITLEFEYGKPSIFHVIDSLGRRDSNWRMDARERNDSLLQISGLDEQEFQSLKKSLKRIRCIGIETGYPDYCDIWCTRAGMGLFSYRVYLRPLSDEEKGGYLNDGHFIPYNDHMLFMFDSSIGNDTFDKEVKERYLDEFHWKELYYNGN